MSLHASRQNRSRRTRTVAVSGAVAVALVAGSVAFATWIVSGDGSAPVSSASIQKLTLDAAPASGLYPGGTVSSTVQVSNPNPYPLSVLSVDATPDSTCFSAGPRQTTSSLVLPPATLNPDGRTYTAGRFALELDFTMPLSAPPTCAGSDFTAHFTVTATTDH